MGKKILFINNYRASYVIPELLARSGFDVENTAGEPAALRELNLKSFDIVIAMDGPESPSYLLCERVRKRTDAPIIVISPEASTDTCVRAINAGADYFMRKPFGPLEFVARINSLLQRSSTRQPVNAVKS